MFEIRFLALALWQWLALFVLVLLASATGWIGTVLALHIFGPIVRRAAPVLGDHLLTVLVGSLRLALGVTAFSLGSGLLNLSISAHQFFREAEKTSPGRRSPPWSPCARGGQPRSRWIGPLPAADPLRHRRRAVLIEIRRMLYAHPRVDPRPARIRFVNFGAYSLDLEIFAYVLTMDYDEFLAIQEDIYLRIMDIIEQSGTGFAFPSQTTYFARDQGLDGAKGEAAEARVAEWRRAGALHLPDFPAETVAALKGTLDYPPGGSAGRARPSPGNRQG